MSKSTLFYRLPHYTPQQSEEIRYWKSYYTHTATQFPSTIQSISIAHNSDSLYVAQANHIDLFSTTKQKVTNTYPSTHPIHTVALRNDGTYLLRLIDGRRK